MKILAIQSHFLDPPGIIQDCIEEKGWFIDIRCAFKHDRLPENDQEFEAIIVLGGPMNADDENYPHLKKTVNLIKQFHSKNKPILGVCLGAQLIAKAFGQRVYPNGIPEIGFTSLYLTPHGKQDPLFEEIEDKLHLMQWHFDTFDLPKQATLLMTNEVCKNQVYRIDKNIYGFQCHFEVTPKILKAWIEAKEQLLEGQLLKRLEKINHQIEEHIENSNLFCRSIVNRWLGLVETQNNIHQ